MKRKTVPTSPKVQKSKEDMEERTLETIYKDDLQHLRKPPSNMNIVMSWLTTIVIALVAGACGFALLVRYGDRWSFTEQFVPSGGGKEVIVREVVTTGDADVALSELEDALQPVIVRLFPKEIANDGSLSEIYTDFDRRGMGLILTPDGWAIAPSAVFTSVDFVAITEKGEILDVTQRLEDPVAGMTYFKIDLTDSSVVQFYTGRDAVQNGTSVWVVDYAASHHGVSLSTATLGDADFSVITDDADYLRSTENLNRYYNVDVNTAGDPLGAPVINEDGDVIGVLDRDVSLDGVVWFVRDARDWAAQTDNVLTDGEIARPLLGVRYLDLSESVGFNPRTDDVLSGAYLYDDAVSGTDAVVGGSPAADAALADGDIIIAVDGDEVSAEQSLTDLIQAHQPGDKVTLSVIRGKAELTVTVTLGTVES